MHIGTLYDEPYTRYGNLAESDILRNSAPAAVLKGYIVYEMQLGKYAGI